MPEVIKKYIDYLENSKKLSKNTLISYMRDINAYHKFLEKNDVPSAFLLALIHCILKYSNNFRYPLFCK